MSRPQHPRLTATDPSGASYWLRRRDVRGREYQVIAWVGDWTRVLAICPTYEAALAAFRLHTIGCTARAAF